MPEKIQKRDGRLESWSVDRIARAILKSLHVSGIKDPVLARRLAGKVEKQLADIAVPEQEEVQDMVEQVLMESRLFSVARKYILYREKRREIRSQDQAFLDVTETIDTYVRGDKARKFGKGAPHSFQGLALHLSGAVQKRYALEQYPEEIRMAHENGYLHIHQLSSGMAGYSAGWSLEKLLTYGFGFKGVCCFGPPLHFDTALEQMVSFLGAMQSEWASVQSFNHVDTLLAPFVRIDDLGYEQVLHYVRNFILVLNGFSRGGEQLFPCSLAFDGAPPLALQGEGVQVGGKQGLGSYDDYRSEMEMINRALCDTLLTGDYLGQPFISPVIIYDLPLEFSWTQWLGGKLIQLVQSGRSPYFRVGTKDAPHTKLVDKIASQQEREELRHWMSPGFPFGAGEMTGSIGVVSLNLPKLAFLAQGEMDFLDLLAEYAEYARDALEFKRKFMEDYMASGMFPYSQHYLENGLRDHFCTIGLVGGHEACMNLLGKGIGSLEGLECMTKVLERMEGLAGKFTHESGHLYNITSIMDNQACYRLAGIDKELYAEIVFSDNGTLHYTNGMYLPVGHGLDLTEFLKHQGALLPLFSGGAVANIDITPFADTAPFVEMLEKIFFGARLPVVHMRCRMS